MPQVEKRAKREKKVEEEERKKEKWRELQFETTTLLLVKGEWMRDLSEMILGPFRLCQAVNFMSI